MAKLFIERLQQMTTHQRLRILQRTSIYNLRFYTLINTKPESEIFYNPILVALNKIRIQQACPTERSKEAMKWLLNFFNTNPTTNYVSMRMT